jgi:arylsulfate sulfotransferase
MTIKNFNKMKNSKLLPFLAFGLILLFSNCSKSYSLDVIQPTVSSPVPTGDFLVAPSGYRDAATGLIIVYDKTGAVKTQIDIGSTSMNFRKWVYADGTTRYSYLKYDANKLHLANVGYNAGEIIILDENFKQINSLTLLPFNGRTAADNNALDGHDFILISDTHYIVMAYFEKAVNNIPASLNPIANCKVVAPIIQEVENGKVVWEWDGTNVPELYTTSVEGNDFTTGALTQDYAHLNSIFLDPKDNNVVVSFRNLNQLMKINHTTSEIMWRLGGKNSDFPVSDDQKFLRQHDAHFLADDKTMILFDNGDITERPYTRIQEFTLDETNKTVTATKSMDMPNKTFSRYMGSVVKTDSSYFIGCGADPRVIEVSLSTNQTIFEKQLALPSYRAYRY